MPCKIVELDLKINQKNKIELTQWAGGSQIRISAKGIEIITPSKFESKAGQHIFTTGAKVAQEFPLFPMMLLNDDLCPLTYTFGKSASKDSPGGSNTMSHSASSGGDYNIGHSAEESSAEAQDPPQPITLASNTAVKGLPPIKVVDLSKIQGHSCTVIPPFKLLKNKMAVLCGTYHQTRSDGTAHYIEYTADQDKETANFFIEDIAGVKKTTRILNYDGTEYFVDIEFNAEKNILTATIKIKLFPCTLVENATGKITEYDAGKHSLDLTYEFIQRDITPELKEFIQTKQKLVNSILNKDGYYLTPKDCTKSGGCTCKVAVIFNVEYSFTTIKPNRKKRPYGVVYLLPVAFRQDAGHWSELESKTVTKTAETKYEVINGNVITQGGGAIKVIEMFDTTMTFCHESCHLFGFPDEYFENGGAVHKMYIDPTTKLIDIKKSQPENDWKRNAFGQLMSTPKLNELPIIPAYYYEEYRKIFVSQTRLEWEIKKI